MPVQWDQPGRSGRDRSACSASRDCSFEDRFALTLHEQVEIEDDAQVMLAMLKRCGTRPGAVKLRGDCLGSIILATDEERDVWMRVP